MSAYPSWVKPHLRQRLAEEAAEKEPKTVDGLEYVQPVPPPPSYSGPTKLAARVPSIGDRVRIGKPTQADPTDAVKWKWYLDRYDQQVVTVDLVNRNDNTFRSDIWWFSIGWIVEYI